jgi:anti-sigma factor RsiW
MSCPDLLHTQALLDGELEENAAAKAERHIAGCPECQELRADFARLSDAIGRNAARHRAPASLRNRIGAALHAEHRAAKVLPFPTGRRNFWFGAASGAGVSALAAALAFLIILPPSAATLTESVTDAHTQALMTGQTIQVASSNHHTVKPWFAGRVPVSPPVADFAPQGFPLAGGRIDKVAGTTAAVVAYRHGKHEIDLFVWPDRGSRLPGQSTTRGYHSVFWKSGDLDFAAVSDTDRTELNKFVTLVRGQPE